MPWVDFIWFQRPLEKIDEHGVTRGEVEFVLRNARSEAIYRSRTSERMVVRGLTMAGRMIAVVFEWADSDQTTVAPVTAYEVED